ncbi:MAG: heat-inducible transcription repressor HrcA [Oscillospiraceae bacterium]|nr:heat-inducible transcription repressor HrcA [Oscillospiraceae bacterium]
MTVDQRKQRILEAIVALYAMDGEPVGSSLLSRYMDMAVSSATLRNEMAALTRLGLLEQPHTSAGRVPSAKGYRYYLDHVLTEQDPQTMPAAEKRQIDAAMAALDFEPEHLAQGAARLLAQSTGFTVAATTPAADDLCIAHFEVVQVGRYSAAVLAVTANGAVRTRVARVERGLTRADAAKVAALLNSGLTFVSLADLTPRLLAAFAAQLAPDSETLMPVVMAAAALLEEAARPKAYLEGVENMLRWPQLHSCLPDLLHTFNSGEAAGRLITPPTNRVSVLLGDDLEHPMPGLCIMSSRYLAGGGLTGSIALIGPTRMPFQQLMPRLEYFTAKLGQYMSGKTIQEEI